MSPRAQDELRLLLDVAARVSTAIYFIGFPFALVGGLWMAFEAFALGAWGDVAAGVLLPLLWPLFLFAVLCGHGGCAETSQAWTLAYVADLGGWALMSWCVVGTVLWRWLRRRPEGPAD